MSENEDKKPSLLERMRQRQANVKSTYDFTETKAVNKSRTCPNCGAGRAEDDGLIYCAFCGFKFLNNDIDNGIYLKEEKQ